MKGKRGLIIGAANAQSIATGCARLLHQAGAELAITYLNKKAEPFVREAVKDLNPAFFLPYDVRNPEQHKKLFEEARKVWGSLDFIIHSIAYAEQQDLKNPFYRCSKDGFLKAMEISCYSFIRIANEAISLMPEGGTLLTMSYLGADRVFPAYGLMGPVKAALESCIKYLAAELGPKKIRVLGLSPGPLPTRAASGIPYFDRFIETARQKSPLQGNMTIEDVGRFARFLLSNEAKHLTGDTYFIDNGYHIMGLNI